MICVASTRTVMHKHHLALHDPLEVVSRNWCRARAAAAAVSAAALAVRGALRSGPKRSALVAVPHLANIGLQLYQLGYVLADAQLSMQVATGLWQDVCRPCERQALVHRRAHPCGGARPNTRRRVGQWLGCSHIR